MDSEQIEEQKAQAAEKALVEQGLPQNGERALSLKDARSVAKIFLDSGLFKDVKSLNQATVKVMAGYELGLGPFASMRGFNIIEGQLAPNANLLGAFIKQHPDYDYRVVESTREKCIIDFYQKGEKAGTTSWDLKDAELAGLANKLNWKKYPRAMLYSRALTEGCRQHAPNVFMGSVYVPEELGSDIEDAEWEELDNNPGAPSVDQQRQPPPKGSTTDFTALQVLSREEHEAGSAFSATEFWTLVKRANADINAGIEGETILAEHTSGKNTNWREAVNEVLLLLEA